MSSFQFSEGEIEAFFNEALRLTKEAGIVVVDAISRYGRHHS
jgi:hypothetical protein